MKGDTISKVGTPPKYKLCLRMTWKKSRIVGGEWKIKYSYSNVMLAFIIMLWNTIYCHSELFLKKKPTLFSMVKITELKRLQDLLGYFLYISTYKLMESVTSSFNFILSEAKFESLQTLKVNNSKLVLIFFVQISTIVHCSRVL